MEFWRGSFAGKDLILCRTGVSVVNAAAQLQFALDHFPITHVLFAGVAGGTDPALAVGDVVIPENWAYHAEAAYLNEDGRGGYVRPDYLPAGRANFGMIFPTGVEITRPDGAQKRLELIPVDPALLAVARRVTAGLPPMKNLDARCASRPAAPA
jgi:adenosylhomocysteine nucleosidase